MKPDDLQWQTWPSTTASGSFIKRTDRPEATKEITLAVPIMSVVGDSVWDMLAARRAQALGIGVLSGGYGREELETAGAYRSYDDPRDLLEHIDELGIRTG